MLLRMRIHEGLRTDGSHRARLADVLSRCPGLRDGAVLLAQATPMSIKITEEAGGAPVTTDTIVQIPYTGDIFRHRDLAYQRTAALKAAVELEVFTAIAEGADTVGALATRCAASERGIRILCDYLTISRLLTKAGDRYQLTPDSALLSGEGRRRRTSGERSPLSHRQTSSALSMDWPRRFVAAPWRHRRTWWRDRNRSCGCSLRAPWRR